MNKFQNKKLFLKINSEQRLINGIKIKFSIKNNRIEIKMNGEVLKKILDDSSSVKN